MTRQLVAPGENAALTYRRLRALIGWVGLSLPVVLLLAGAIDGHLLASMSAYFYSAVGPYFTGTLCVIGVFLVAYRLGRLVWENTLTTIAGIAALGVAFFHAAPPGATPTEVVLADVHLACAGVLFVSLGAISVFLFPTDLPPGRNGLTHTYRGLGIVIWLAIAAMLVLNYFAKAFYDHYLLFFWLECVCVIAFAASFIIKGHERCPPRVSGAAPGADAPSPAAPTSPGRTAR